MFKIIQRPKSIKYWAKIARVYSYFLLNYNRIQKIENNKTTDFRNFVSYVFPQLFRNLH